MRTQPGVTLQSSVSAAVCACAWVGRDEHRNLALCSALTSTINPSQSWQMDNVEKRCQDERPGEAQRRHWALLWFSGLKPPISKKGLRTTDPR